MLSSCTWLIPEIELNWIVSQSAEAPSAENSTFFSSIFEKSD